MATTTRSAARRRNPRRGPNRPPPPIRGNLSRRPRADFISGLCCLLCSAGLGQCPFGACSVASPADENPTRYSRTAPGARYLDFLSSPRACIRAPRISGFWTVGFIWNSLESLVRNEPFQWVTSDPGPILFFARPLPERIRRKRRPSSIRRSTALNRLAGRKRPGKPGMMAVDIARVRSGIAIKVTPSSLFCKELSIWRHFMQRLRRAWSLSNSVADRAPHRASHGGVLASTQTQFAVAEFSGHSAK